MLFLSAQLMRGFIRESEGINLDHGVLRVEIWCYDVTFGVDEINYGPFPLHTSGAYDNDGDQSDQGSSTCCRTRYDAGST